MKPIEIIGAGLAGLALGNALQRSGVPVTLHEAGTLPRHRVCGEFICGGGAAALKTLGLEDSLEGAAIHRSTLWQVGGRTVLTHDLPHPAIGLSRYRLDQRLADSFTEAGGRLELNSRQRIRSDCDGQIVCKGRKASPSRWIGLKAHYHNLSLEADLELHLGKGGYVGLSKVEDDRINVCALFKQDPSLRSKREHWLDHYLRNTELSCVADRLAEARVDRDSHCGVAGVQFSKIPPRRDASLRLGDAYSVIPPFTGNGMSIALESAAIATPILLDYADGSASWASARSEVDGTLHRTLDGRLRAARWLHPMLHGTLGQQTLAAFARARLLPFNLLYSLTH